MSKFPNELDTDAELPGIIDGSTEISADAINAQKDSILAIERTLGTDVQGSTASLSDRLAVSINPDGTLDAAAISSAWLIGSPIMNANISLVAAIAESKLDLDVGTADLQDQVTSARIDIDALQDSVATQIAVLASHIAGTDDQHFAEDIVVSPAIAGGLNVQTALSAVQLGLTNHISDSSGAHDADAISYSPGVNSSLTADSVGGALDEIDTNFINRVNRHLDTAHTNGISADEYIYLGGQGAVNSASLAGAPLQPLGGQPRIKIGGINNATIITKGANPAGLNASASSLVVDYSDGLSTYATTITTLGSCPYPAGGSENRLKGVVRVINDAFVAAGALVTAFEYQNEVVLQHNTPDGYLTIRAPGSNSAITALGLSEVEGLSSSPFNHIVSVTDGVPLDNWAPLLSGPATLASPSFNVTLVSPAQTGALIHITEHSGLGSGTYQVLSVAGNVATLNRSVPAGSFKYAIYPDSISIGTPSSGSVYDVFVDSAGVPSSAVRVQTTVLQISGLRMTGCSLLPGTYSVSLTGSGSNILLKIVSGTFNGDTVRIASGYLGRVTCRAPNGLGEATFEVSSLAPSSPATDTLSVLAYAGEDNLQKILSFWSNGSVSEFPLDSRNIGLSGKSAIGTDVVRDIIGKGSFNRFNGLIEGDVPTVSGLVVSIPIQKFSIGGVVRAAGAVQIDLTSFATAVQSANLYIDLSGSYRLSLNSTAGFSLADIVRRGEIPLLRIDLGVSSVTSTTDIRIFSLSTALSEQLMVGDSSVDKHCTNLPGALLIAEAGGFTTIAVQGDQSTTARLSVAAGIRISARAVTCGGIDLGTGSTLDALSVASSSSLTLANSATLSARTISATSIQVGEYASLAFVNSTLTGTGFALTVSGTGSSIRGLGPGASLTFSSSGTVSIVGSSDSSLSGFSCVFSSVVSPWISMSGSCSDIRIDNVSATKASPISSFEMTSHSVISNTGLLSGLTISGGLFSECGTVFKCTSVGSVSSLHISNISTDTFGGIIDSASVAMTGATLTGINGKKIKGNIISASGTANIVLSDSTFSGTLGSAYVTARAFYSTGSVTSVNATISNCSFSDIRFTDNVIYAAGLSGAGAVRLNVSDCIFSNILSVTSQSDRSVAPGNLINWNSSDWLELSNNIFSSSIFKILFGYNATISGNTFNLSSTLYPFNINRAVSSLQPLANIRSNRIRLASLSSVNLDCSLVSDNDITGGEFLFQNSTAGLTGFAGYVVNDNTFSSTDTTGAFTTAFTIYPGYTVSGNKFSGNPTEVLVKLGSSTLAQGLLKFYENDCQFDSTIPSFSIVKAEDSFASQVQYVLDGNNIKIPVSSTGSVINAVHLAANNVSCTRNSISGTNVTGIIFRGNGGTQTGCSVVGNFVTGAVVEGTDMSIGQNSFADNRGVGNIYMISPYSASLVTSTLWTEDPSSLMLTSSGATATAWVPLNLPSGQLTAVALDITASGIVEYKLYSLLAVGSTQTLLDSGSITTGPATTVALVPSTAHFTGPLSTVAVRIRCNASGSKIGNIRAVIKL